MRSHGKLALEWQGELLIVRPQGPFNEEGVAKARRHLIQSIKNSQHNYWLRLEIWDEESLGSPRVMAQVNELFQWCQDHGCQSTAVVVCNRIQAGIIESQFIDDIAVFDDTEHALDWLEKIAGHRFGLSALDLQPD
ncbi:hypothetical protein MIB92_11345 [Aestuariirhabdus sp. Z084]|uniref:hypothetical protein n=1 Tax=Aestuariirhabdus haliotis TaxID=2918751 RepID=UPI00201B3845|nr:hypothetical protein [Aestuariirhabdus haliotis]MCL6416248.1 hypothetical protein [Aestuariirhabdus haliotis]MCL6420292.1 hypothetical protein [Aestuariirhabdus haliotis]